MNIDLDGKRALVTGGSSGIGEAIVMALADAGAKVGINCRAHLEAAQEIVTRILKRRGEAFAVQADVSEPEAVARMFQELDEKWGGIDILVNNAGTNPHFGPILTAEESQWDKTLEVNLKGYVRVIRVCVDGMRQRGGGKIINMASVAGLQAQPGLGVYGVSKAAVLMLTRLLAIELAPANIQVNAIAPGVIKTQFSRLLWDTPEIRQAILAQIPAQRVGQPEELTGIALYLASRASDFTTGAVFVVDGGQTAGRAPLPNSD